MRILPRADEAVIPVEKFTKYVLHPENSNGKYRAFESALGYNLENYHHLIENIRENLHRFPATISPDKGHGVRYVEDMNLIGLNSKNARVITVWLDDSSTGEMRLITVYIKKRSKNHD